VLQKEEAEKELAPLAEAMKAALGDRVERVVVSRRLADSPVALVTSKFGWSANMERIMKTQVQLDVLVISQCGVQAS
jgi:HSP90 family molecular chaperone